MLELCHGEKTKDEIQQETRCQQENERWQEVILCNKLHNNGLMTDWGEKRYRNHRPQWREKAEEDDGFVEEESRDISGKECAEVVMRQ